MALFMTAEWRRLINLTYAVEPALLQPHLPRGLALDVIDGKAFVGLVPFSFEKICLRGYRIPFHTRFPEINLRFYVRHGDRRGVVFLQECAPKAAVVWLARKKYNEPYRKMRMQETVRMGTGSFSVRQSIWCGGKKNFVEVEAGLNAFVPAAHTHDHYFKELEFGFGSGHDGKTKLYRVHHPAWEIFPVQRVQVDLDFAVIFGKKWAFLSGEKPFNAALVKGSAVQVYDIEDL